MKLKSVIMVAVCLIVCSCNQKNQAATTDHSETSDAISSTEASSENDDIMIDADYIIRIVNYDGNSYAEVYPMLTENLMRGGFEEVKVLPSTMETSEGTEFRSENREYRMGNITVVFMTAVEPDYLVNEALVKFGNERQLQHFIETAMDMGFKYTNSYDYDNKRFYVYDYNGFTITVDGLEAYCAFIP